MLLRSLFILLCSITLQIPVVGYAAEPLSVYFVDVGQGDATLLHQPGKCSILVDAGPADAAPRLATLLHDRGIRSLDYLVVTHPHPDHFGGVPELMKSVLIREISDNGDANPEDPAFANYSRQVYDIPYSVVAQGDSWQCGDLEVEVLHPTYSYSGGGNFNNRSLALSIRYNDFRLALMGDVAAAGEKELLKYNSLGQAMVVKLGHHGAADGTSIPLLERLRPRVAVISVGRNNRIQAPAPAVLGRLAEFNVRTYRTDIDGTIHLKVAENGNIRVRP